MSHEPPSTPGPAYLPGGRVPAPWAGDEGMREHFRSICSTLRSDAALPEVPCVAVVGTTAGEGASWVASRLACALAETSDRVALVDVDRAHPCQDGRFGVNGTGEPFTAAEGLSFVARPTAWPHLTVVTPSPAVSMEPEALSRAVRAALAVLRVRARAIVLDAEPMRESGQVLQLAGAIDGVLYVIESERVRREVILRSHEALRRAGIRVLGVVLNKQRRYIPDPIYRAL